MLKRFVRYCSLSVLGMIGMSCYVLADTYFIAQGLGADGLTALNLAIPAYNLIFGCGLMIGVGGATKFAISAGRRDARGVDLSYTSGIWLAVLCSLLLVPVGAFGARPLAALLGGEGVVLDMTTTYLKWLFLFAPAFILNSMLQCFVRSDGAPQLATASVLVSSLANIVLDYVFIFVFHWGMFGAVFATGLSPVISMGILSSRWLKKGNTFRFRFVLPEGTMAVQELALGLPSLVTQLSGGVVMVTFNFLLLHLEGNLGVAAYGVTANIAVVVTGMFGGVAQGVQPLFCDAYGREATKELERLLKWSLLTVGGLALLLYLGLALGSAPICGAFHSGQDPRLQRLAEGGLRLYFLSNLPAGLNQVLSIWMTSVERTRPAQLISLLRGFVIILPLSITFAMVWGITGVWLAFPGSELAALLLTIALISRKKKPLLPLEKGV